MKVRTVTGGVTKEGVHYSSRGMKEVPDDFFDRVLAWASDPKNLAHPTHVIVAPEVAELFKAELRRG